MSQRLNFSYNNENFSFDFPNDIRFTLCIKEIKRKLKLNIDFDLNSTDVFILKSSDGHIIDFNDSNKDLEEIVSLFGNYFTIVKNEIEYSDIDRILEAFEKTLTIDQESINKHMKNKRKKLINTINKILESSNKLKTTQIILKDLDITILPVELFNFHNLISLDISNNFLTSIPDSIKNLQNLKDLNLSGNKLSSLPNQMESLINLESLDLSNNDFSNLSDPFFTLPNLRFLNLSGNNLPNSVLEKIKFFPNIKFIDISYNNIKIIPREFIEIPNKFVLNISQSEFPDIPNEILECPQLDKLLIGSLIPEIILKVDHGIPLTGDEWKASWDSITKFWYYTKNFDLIDLCKTDWLYQQCIKKIKSKISSEILTNFIIGCNNIKSGELLKNEQREVDPRWFVELPLKINHKEKFLKIRVNNLIKLPNDQFLSYPDPVLSYLPIKRIQFEAETPWFSKIEIDNIFEPNTLEESNIYEKDPNNTWLTDIFIFELGNNIKSIDNLNLTFSISIFIDKGIESVNNEIPDIKTTKKAISLPIIRQNNFQQIEKYQYRYANLLTILLVIASIIQTSIAIVINPQFSNISAYFGNIFNSSFVIFISSIILVFLVILTLTLLFKKKNDKIFDFD